MKLKTWRRHHNRVGIVICFFLLMFCLSGIVLNHRGVFANAEISRKWLPSRYEYNDWNGGLMRGTLNYEGHVLVYGANGIWLTDSIASSFADFNHGIPSHADFRQVRGMVSTSNGRLYAVTPTALYRYYGGHIGWRAVSLPVTDDDRLSDVTAEGDTVVVAGRSYLYVSLGANKPFVRTGLQAPDGFENKGTLFRTIWLLHSGELFGTVGKLVVDAIALIMIVLCITGFAYWLLPKYAKKRHVLIRLSLLWHDRIGRATIILTLLTAVSGWCLRPPVMIPLAMTKAKAVPYTTLDSHNPWHDRLRMVRYDTDKGDWLLSTSDGMFSLPALSAKPVRLSPTPPVSVMGLNVLQKDSAGRWLCGSFSGLFIWDRDSGKSTDFFTNEPAPAKAGPPFGKKAISGFSADFKTKPFAVEYYDGTTAVRQPETLRQLPMSLWNVALEVHSGRIFIGIYATFVFVLIVGGACIWCLWSGYKIRRKSPKHTRQNTYK